MLNNKIGKRAQIGMLGCINSSKRGQIGETLTWIVATIIIIAVLVVSIFISTAYVGNNKEIQSSQTTDILASKSMYSYLSTWDSNRKTVYSQLKEEENLNEFNGKLAQKIFLEYYRDEYTDVWLGFHLLENDYFGEWVGVLEGERFIFSAKDDIHLNENKTLRLILVE